MSFQQIFIFDDLQQNLTRNFFSSGLFFRIRFRWFLGRVEITHKGDSTTNVHAAVQFSTKVAPSKFPSFCEGRKKMQTGLRFRQSELQNWFPTISIVYIHIRANRPRCVEGMVEREGVGSSILPAQASVLPSYLLINDLFMCRKIFFFSYPNSVRKGEILNFKIVKCRIWVYGSAGGGFAQDLWAVIRPVTACQLGSHYQAVGASRPALPRLPPQVYSG